MRLGTSSPLSHSSPEEWASNQVKLGCSTVVFPVQSNEPRDKIDAYKKDQETKRSELINKLSNGNEELKAQMKDVDLKTLELWDNLQAHEQPPQGISTNNAEGLNEGDGSTDAEKERENRMNAVENAFPDLFNKEE